MKRMLAIWVASGLTGGIAHSQSFPSVNSVGVVPVTIPPAGASVLLGINLQQLNGAGAIGAVQLFGSNQLVRANMPQFATQIHIWDSANQQFVTLYQRLDGRYRLTTGQFTNYPLRTGDAVWLQSPSTSTAPRTIYLVGEVLAGLAVQRPMVPGLRMIANPFMAPWYLNGPGMSWVADGAKRGLPSTADLILIWDGNVYRTYYLRAANSNWCNAADNTVLTTPVPIGRGFWYHGRGTSYVSRIPRWTGN
ncbi:MAG: hypothetical protein N2652_03360 [Kiritimatiellae bacterium]|nr:hypothetical protein [Kiritimatiellia bacterium]